MRFLCPHCRTITHLPVCKNCGYEIPVIDDIYQMTDMPNINMENSAGKRYIGYDKIGEDFDPGAFYCDQWLTRYGVYKSCSQKLTEVFGKNIAVLDIGAGLGAASIPLANAGVSVTAADISQNMLAILRSRLDPEASEFLTCCRMNAYQLMLPDSSMDVVIENGMLHLIENPRMVIQEIIRVLKPMGVLVRYSSSYLQGEPCQYEVNNLYVLAIKDIMVYYFKTLKKYGYEEFYFDNHADEIISEYFNEPIKIQTDLEREFTQKMKLRIHRLRTKAHSGLQHVPDEIHRLVWQETEKYAAAKYGENFDEIPSYSKYTSSLTIYKLKESSQSVSLTCTSEPGENSAGRPLFI